MLERGMELRFLLIRAMSSRAFIRAPIAVTFGKELSESKQAMPGRSMRLVGPEAADVLAAIAAAGLTPLQAEVARIIGSR